MKKYNKLRIIKLVLSIIISLLTIAGIASRALADSVDVVLDPENYDIVMNYEAVAGGSASASSSISDQSAADWSEVSRDVSSDPYFIDSTLVSGTTRGYQMQMRNISFDYTLYGDFQPGTYTLKITQLLNPWAAGGSVSGYNANYFWISTGSDSYAYPNFRNRYQTNSSSSLSNNTAISVDNSGVKIGCVVFTENRIAEVFPDYAGTPDTGSDVYYAITFEIPVVVSEATTDLTGSILLDATTYLSCTGYMYYNASNPTSFLPSWNTYGSDLNAPGTLESYIVVSPASGSYVPAEKEQDETSYDGVLGVIVDLLRSVRDSIINISINVKDTVLGSSEDVSDFVDLIETFKDRFYNDLISPFLSILGDIQVLLGTDRTSLLGSLSWGSFSEDPIAYDYVLRIPAFNLNINGSSYDFWPAIDFHLKNDLTDMVLPYYYIGVSLVFALALINYLWLYVKRLIRALSGDASQEGGNVIDS